MNLLEFGQAVWQRATIAGTAAPGFSQVLSGAVVLLSSLTLLPLAVRGAPAARKAHPRRDGWRLITLDPAHFHAALIHKQSYPGVSNKVAVYAPLGPDLLAHLARLAQFNSRAENPTRWELEVYAGPDFLKRMLAERRGDVVVMSGRNRDKIGRIQASLEAGLHVLADKPWIIEAGDLPKLEEALRTAERRGLIAYDIMTERFEATNMLQRELVRDPEIFGTILSGSAEQPGVYMESVHHIYKAVAGVPSLRPLAFFDINEQGEGLSDVGTHLVDLVQWMLFPDQALDWRKDIEVLEGKRWPEVISREAFRRVTGEADFPENLRPWVRDDRLEYYCNNRVTYKLRDVHVRLDVLWRYEAPAGAGDTHYAVFRGSRCRVEIRQGAREAFRPELYVIPNEAAGRDQIRAALARKLETLQRAYPGVGLEDRGTEFRVTIPDSLRVGHEAHFAQVVEQFLKYLEKPARLPAWETPYMLAKYYVTTKGVELARRAETGGAK